MSGGGFIESADMESATPTPYAVRCACRSGLIFLTKTCYDWQMDASHSQWRCPRCLRIATWDDDNYERATDSGNEATT